MLPFKDSTVKTNTDGFVVHSFFDELTLVTPILVKTYSWPFTNFSQVSGLSVARKALILTAGFSLFIASSISWKYVNYKNIIYVSIISYIKKI